MANKMRIAKVTIGDRHDSLSTIKTFSFSSVANLVNKIDKFLDTLPCGHVNIDIEDNGQFSVDEIDLLEEEYICVS